MARAVTRFTAQWANLPLETLAAKATVHEFAPFFKAIVDNSAIEPYGAAFVDGYRNAVICAVILESAASGRRVDSRYED
jgi:hypothetical protein